MALLETAGFGIISILLVLLAGFFFTRYYYRELFRGPLVRFEEDRYIEICLYPHGHKGALVFTCDDINASTKPENIENVLNILERHGAKGVFFVVPFFKGRTMLDRDSSVSKVLKVAEKMGHEIALHGLTHTTLKKTFILERDKEFGDLSPSEQKRMIRKGRRILKDAGFKVNGFRSPAFSASVDTLKVLDSEEFLYSSDTRIRPIMLMSNKRFCRSLYYPYHPEELGILDFTVNGDYFWGYTTLGKENQMSLQHRFDKFYERRGVFTLLSHIDPINSGMGLKALEEFLEYTKSKDLWMPNLSELTEWWLAREVLSANSSIDGNALTITLEKGSEIPLKNLAIRFKPDLRVKKYKIDVDGVHLKEGDISEGTILVDI